MQTNEEQLYASMSAAFLRPVTAVNGVTRRADKAVVVALLVVPRRELRPGRGYRDLGGGRVTAAATGATRHGHFNDGMLRVFVDERLTMVMEI